jgi:hypothetical protein
MKMTTVASFRLRMQTAYELAQVRAREAEIKVKRLAPKVA